MARHYNSEKVPNVYKFEDVPRVELREGVEQQVFRGLDAIIGRTTLTPGCEVGPHSHPWEQIAYIEEGECDFHVGDEIVTVEAGDIFVIPPGVEHYADPTGYDDPVVNLDAWPLREDYLKRTTYQDEFVDY